MIEPYYKSAKNDFLLAKGDTFRLLHEFDFKFDMIFADPRTSGMCQQREMG